jgi:hypothetical protein
MVEHGSLSGKRHTIPMARKITYWVRAGLLAAISLFAGFAYLSGSPQAVQGFAHVGESSWGLPNRLARSRCSYLALPGSKSGPMRGSPSRGSVPLLRTILPFGPLVLLALLVVSYLTRPASRRYPATVTQN